MSFHARPISFKPPRLKGLSARLIASHYENNYCGAVRRLNAIRGELSTLDPTSAPGFRLNGLKREELIATTPLPWQAASAPGAPTACRQNLSSKETANEVGYP